jgi:hypothetical protein
MYRPGDEAWKPGADLHPGGPLPVTARTATIHGPQPAKRRVSTQEVLCAGNVLCASGRIRTCGTWYRKPVLYPLSYGGLHADASCTSMRVGRLPVETGAKETGARR